MSKHHHYEKMSTFEKGVAVINRDTESEKFAKFEIMSMQILPFDKDYDTTYINEDENPASHSALVVFTVKANNFEFELKEWVCNYESKNDHYYEFTRKNSRLTDIIQTTSGRKSVCKLSGLKPKDVSPHSIDVLWDFLSPVLKTVESGINEHNGRLRDALDYFFNV